MKKILLALLAGVSCTVTAHAAATINAVNKYAYGANIGWMDWRGDVANGAIIGEYICRGSIYAANVGWISLGSGTPASGVFYQTNAAADYGVNHDGFGNLRGFAYGANIGWINFEDTGAPRLDLKTGKFIGFVWGANVGWISLSNAFAHVQTDTLRPGLDSDGDGIPDAWELLRFGNLATANATSDQDGDGVSDKGEELADTNPNNPASRLRITSYSFDAGLISSDVEWSSRESRCYRLQSTASLNEPISWFDSGLGLIRPDAGASTARTVVTAPAPFRFFRVEPVKPLSP